ncbi:hypothetical protein BDB00DRAFT_65104 [Zychaea mexicana]|uniref:uncharacterized protein n=1 Tax=Zychaea mexicana TaxID=64656 RepID=UPI0022FE7ABE|nr:uncharacterized protein BDB00DRAFT_65104 [Zychaea mexicana]KAI9488144.1 hypothetical protein BDB00DRAFT_65104 [Zychaea mexicana]
MSFICVTHHCPLSLRCIANNYFLILLTMVYLQRERTRTHPFLTLVIEIFFTPITGHATTVSLISLHETRTLPVSFSCCQNGTDTI